MPPAPRTRCTFTQPSRQECIQPDGRTAASPAAPSEYRCPARRWSIRWLQRASQRLPEPRHENPKPLRRLHRRTRHSGRATGLRGRRPEPGSSTRHETGKSFPQVDGHVTGERANRSDTALIKAEDEIRNGVHVVTSRASRAAAKATWRSLRTRASLSAWRFTPARRQGVSITSRWAARRGYVRRVTSRQPLATADGLTGTPACAARSRPACFVDRAGKATDTPPISPCPACH